MTFSTVNPDSARLISVSPLGQARGAFLVELQRPRREQHRVVQPAEDQRGHPGLVRLQLGRGHHDVGRAQDRGGGRGGLAEQAGEVQLGGAGGGVADEGGDARGQPVSVLDLQVAGRAQDLGQLVRAGPEPPGQQPVGALPGQLGLLGEHVEHPGHAAPGGRRRACHRP
ncbi:hypothetical protein GCM10020220_111710 [Nonomuraea rubra]